ncbi:MAG: translation initiation factor 2 [Firmicutes bacterium]|nr:translation initiation factor 2 [Bacillota bacterium]MBQ9060304.1 translation initiation factor 2 [Bacillota bacterium]
MIGRYEIEVYNNRIHYFLTVKRNITILQGNSATGKTELIRLIQEYEANGASSGITLRCDAKCTVLTSIDWELRMQALSGTIVFIDETATFLKSGRFAELVKGSDNYYVIVTRDDLGQLPYSVEEIYGLRNVTDSQKYKKYRRVYNEMYRLYHFDIKDGTEPETVITEDSNSGFDYFNLLFPKKCISSHGKARVQDMIRKEQRKTMLIIVDGAAFGSEIGKVMRYIKSNHIKCALYAPESFEYLVLSAGLFDVPKSVLGETYLFADSKQYMSWESFYTSYLTDMTRNTIFQYGKMSLPAYYRSEGNVRKIAEQLPPVLQDNSTHENS